MSYSDTIVHYHSGGPDKNRSPLALHTHAQYEIYCLIEGRRSYLFENSHYDLEPGDFALIAPGIKHITRGDSYKRVVIYVSDEFISPELIPYVKKCFDAVLIKPPPSHRRKMLDIIDNLSRETSFNMEGNTVMIRSLLSELIIELYRFMETGSNSAVSGKDGVTNKILETVSYINQHYMENITINSLAAKAFTNIARRITMEEVPFLELTEKKSLLHRIFKK